jgi:hypothetical protein
MNYHEKAKIILTNIYLFNSQREELRDKVTNIAKQCANPDMYNASKKQIFFIEQAYNHILPRLLDQKEKENKLAKMSETDRLWEIYSSNEWDEESGPYKSMSYGQYVLLVKEFEKTISSLKREIIELRNNG